MHIQSYQIHNVLNVYRRQLSQGESHPASGNAVNGTKRDSVTISSNGNNQSVMEKVAANVLKKITNIDPETGFGKEMLKQTQSLHKNLQLFGKENEFVFNTIAENNRKETRSIAVDNSQVLLNRLDELAKAAINRKNEENSVIAAEDEAAERTD